MHVAVVSPYDPTPDGRADPLALRGGVEDALSRTAKGLAARGHRVTLVTSARRASETEEAGVRVVRVPRRGSLYRAPLAPFHRAIPREADVIHVPATYPFLSDLVPLREARRRGRPVVLDYHFDVHGTTLPMRAAAALHLRTLATGMARARMVVAKSEDYARASRFLARVPRERFAVVPNGVDLDEVPLGRGPREGLLCVGRLVPYKGVDVLLAAMPAVHEATGARLTIVGDGPERTRLQALAERTGAPVTFAGRLARPELVASYGRARLTVLPSVNGQEAFGIALLESLAAGTPVVASSLPGVREVARLGGLLAAPGDPRSLADAIIEAWRSGTALGTPLELRGRVARTYAWSRVVERWERVHEEALAT